MFRASLALPIVIYAGQREYRWLAGAHPGRFGAAGSAGSGPVSWTLEEIIPGGHRRYGGDGDVLGDEGGSGNTRPRRMTGTPENAIPLRKMHPCRLLRL
jgi:hypothetical protein